MVADHLCIVKRKARNKEIDGPFENLSTDLS
jgi:hypothetical protein